MSILVYTASTTYIVYCAFLNTTAELQSLELFIFYPSELCNSEIKAHFAAFFKIYTVVFVSTTLGFVPRPLNRPRETHSFHFCQSGSHRSEQGVSPPFLSLVAQKKGRWPLQIWVDWKTQDCGEYSSSFRLKPFPRSSLNAGEHIGVTLSATASSFVSAGESIDQNISTRVNDQKARGRM